MKITDVRIDGFGVWSGLSLDGLSDRLTVIFGANEAGKTTVMQFVRGVLYGFTPPRRRRYFPPLHGGPAGGAIVVSDEGGQCEIRRCASEEDAEADPGRLRVLGPNRRDQGPGRLEALLGGVDEAVFTNVFAIGLRELQELGSLDETSAAQQLYKLASGLDRVSLIDVIETLRTARERIIGADGAHSEIGELLARRDKLDSEIERLAAQGRRWPPLANQLAELRRQAEQLGEAVERLEREARTVELALQVRPIWLEQKQVDQQLASLAPATPLPDGAIEELSRREEQLGQSRRRLAEIKRRRRRIREEAAAQPLDRRLWSQRSRVAAMAEHAPWIASLQSQIDRLREEVASLEAARRDQGRRLGLSSDQTERGLPRVSTRTLAALREPARAVRDAARRRDQARRDQENRQRESQRIEQQVRDRLAHTVQGDLVAAVERTGQRVNWLRRRVQVDERIEQLVQHRRDLEEQVQGLVAGGPPPLRVLAGLGVLFIAGVMLILTGLLGGSFFGLSSELGWPLAVLGVGGAGVAILAKTLWERSSVRRLESCREQLGRIQKQLEQDEAEREELRRQFPPQPGTLSEQLKAAQAELRRLEEFLPLDAQRQAALQQIQEAASRFSEAEAALSEAKRRWKTALQHCGLPGSLSPRQVRSLVEYSKQSGPLRRQLENRREELKRRESDLARLARRIRQLFTRLQLEGASDDPHEQLRLLASALADQEQRARNWAQLQARDRRLRDQQAATRRRARRIQQRSRALLAAAGASDLEDFRRIARQHAQRIPLLRRREQLAAQIAAVIGTNGMEQSVLDELAQCGDGPDGAARLEQRWDRAVAQLQEMQTRRDQALQQRGAVEQEMKNLVENRRLDAARLERASVAQQIDDAIERWRVLALADRLLDSVRQTYEKQRQPETLQEASEYLRQLTNRRHVRIWTPLDQDALYVDDALGRSLPLEILSCGAREAVFLSLRLALASAYAKRGADLPLVLDDVLVNLDAQRAKAAAALLRNFAKSGRQVLLFTCHEHIQKLFKAARCDVRRLPDYAQLPPLDANNPPTDNQLPVPAEEREDDMEQIEAPEEEIDEDQDEQYEYEDEEPEEDDQYEDEEQDEEEEEYEDEYEDEYEYEDDEGEDEEEDGEDQYEDDEEGFESPAAGDEAAAIEDEAVGGEEEEEEEAYDEDEYEEDEWDEQDESEEAGDVRALQDAEPGAQRPEEDGERGEDGGGSGRPSFTWESPERWWEDGSDGAAA